MALKVQYPIIRMHGYSYSNTELIDRVSSGPNWYPVETAFQDVVYRLAPVYSFHGVVLVYCYIFYLIQG